MVETVYTRRDGRGRFRAFLLDVDLKKYDLVPVLANGEILGRTTVSRMSDEVDAVAAINSNYFALSGEILGMLRMDGKVVGTTYFTRSALGVKKDGAPFVDQVYYSGRVTIGKKSVLVSGVNAERGENTLIIYNRAYDVRTNTNQYGKEFVVQGGKVVKINQGNSIIPEDGYVVSVHGTAKNAFSRVRVGDKVTLEEDIGPAFQDVPMIGGADACERRKSQCHGGRGGIPQRYRPGPCAAHRRRCAAEPPCASRRGGWTAGGKHRRDTDGVRRAFRQVRREGGREF